MLTAINEGAFKEHVKNGALDICNCFIANLCQLNDYDNNCHVVIERLFQSFLFCSSKSFMLILISESLVFVPKSNIFA